MRTNSQRPAFDPIFFFANMMTHSGIFPLCWCIVACECMCIAIGSATLQAHEMHIIGYNHPIRVENQPLILLPTFIVLDTIAECETIDVNVVIFNPNSISVRIDSALFSGPSQSEFFLRSPGLPATIRANDSLKLTIRLSPTHVGSKTVSLKFLTQDLTLSSNDISIRGEVIPAALGYSPIGINFGPINIFQFKDQRIYLVNSGSKDVLITRLSIVGVDTAEFHIMNNIAPFILSSGRSYEIIVRFSPTSEGEYRSFLQVNSNDCSGLVTVISMDGVGAVGTIAQIAMPVVRGKPGSKILIPVSMLQPIIDNPSNGFSLLFRYNPTTLLPVDAHFLNTNRFGYTAVWKLINPGQMQIDVNGTMPISDSGVIINIIAEVYLGDAASFPLVLQSFIFKDKHPYNITFNGMFYLDSICQISRQLIRQKSGAHLFQNHPNPAYASTTIEYKLDEDTFITIKILDQLGREIISLVNDHQDKGAYSVQIDLTGIKSGTYFYRLETSRETCIKQMTILR